MIGNASIQFGLCGIAVCLLFLLPGCKGGGGPVIIECGGGAEFSCPKGMYCDYGAGCGGLDQVGRCRRQPKDCPLQDDPVCGCDDVTYRGACYANARGVTVQYRGECIEEEKEQQQTRKKFDFPDTGTVEAGDVESAGDIIREDW